MNIMCINYTYILVITGASLLGLIAGVVGSFIFIQGQSLLADAMSHAALPGIALMFLCTRSKNLLLLLCGGGIAACLGTWLIQLVTQKTSLKHDAMLGVVLSVFFGCGTVLLSAIQKLQLADQAIISKFLFGNAATVLWHEVLIMMIAGTIILMSIFLWWKEWNLLLFDAAFAQAVGYRVYWWRTFLMMLTIATMLIGLQTVGVILMSSFFIAPAAAARQLTSHFKSMLLLSGLFGMISGASGAWCSCMIYHMPTGPIIVVILSIIFLLSYGWSSCK